MIKKIIPYILVAAVLLPILLTHSCANTTEAPTGGLKDTIPPVIVGINPLPGLKNAPLNGLRIVFTFNEFVNLKNPQGLLLSPPLEKKPVGKIRGKSLEVKFEGDLKPQTTYTLELGDAIADVNENNPYAGFTYVFSTGASIDSMYLTGKVFDCEKLEPVKQASVLLYKDHSDSAVFLHRPDYVAKTDEWGFFVFQHLQDTLYRMYALKDESSNNIYDPESDLVGFVDSLIKPVGVMNDTIYELFKFDMKDTLECEKRIAVHSIRIFKEKQVKQYIRNYGRISERLGFVTFQAADTWIDSLWISGYPADRIITQFNQAQDSLLLWINDRRPVPDTLHTFVSYRKTDSLGAFIPAVEHLKLFREGYKRKLHTSRSELKKEDTTCIFKLAATPELVEQEGFKLSFELPVIYEKFGNMTMKMVNPKQKETFVKFEVVKDSSDLRNFSIMPKVKILPGHDFILKVPHKAFMDIAGNWSDSTEVKTALPSDDDLSSLTLSLTNVSSSLIIDLLDERGSGKLRSYSIDKDSRLSFPYLKEGKYVIRISEDRNSNGIIDSGNVLKHIEPEKVVFYMQNGEKAFGIPKASEVEQTIDVSALL